jgi:hypothetical protein
MTELTALHDDNSRDHTAKHCLACAAPTGHAPHCPAANPDATTLLVEQLPGDLTRTWMVSGSRYTLTPARRARYVAQMSNMRWVRRSPGLQLPMSVGLLVNAVLDQWGIGRHVAEIGYGLASVPGTDCGCPDAWRCRCDFPDHPFRHAHPDLWPDYSLLAFKVRGQSSWLRFWLLDIGTGAVYIAEDHTPLPPTPRPISRACFIDWCDTCPGTAPTNTGEPAICQCTHHLTGDPQ